jgi:glycosyltransferase involved in cell wall biosynthesis
MRVVYFTESACGLPVVGGRAGAMLDRVADGVTGFLVPPDSPADMAARIVNTPRTEWRRMGRSARAMVETEFSWNRTFETLMGIYAAAGAPDPRMTLTQATQVTQDARSA